MSEPNPDEDLEALFARQRAVDHERSPAFHAMQARNVETRCSGQSAAPLAWRWALPGAIAIGLAVTAALILHRPDPAAPPRDALARQLEEIDAALQRSAAAQHDLTAWQSPTDFLLHPIQNENHP